MSAAEEEAKDQLANPLTVSELSARLDDLPPDAPIFGYLGSDGFWFQAEPRGAEAPYPTVILTAKVQVTAGGRAS